MQAPFVLFVPFVVDEAGIIDNLPEHAAAGCK
jgi:hypothetical protein